MTPLTASIRAAIDSKLVWARRSVVSSHDDAVPYKLSSFIPEEHINKNGFAYRPTMWVRGKDLVTMDGSVYDEPIDPWSIAISDVHSRFLMNSTSWDEITGTLVPFQSEGIGYTFTSAVDSQPRLENIEYQIGKKIKRVSVLRFDEGDVLTSSFNQGADDASVLTLCVVARVYGTERACLFRIGNEPAEAIELYVGEDFLIRNGSADTVLDTIVAPGAMSPMIVIMTSTPERTLLTVSFLGRLHQKYINNADVTRNLSITFGENLLGQRNLTASLIDVILYDKEKNHDDLASTLRMIYE